MEILEKGSDGDGAVSEIVIGFTCPALLPYDDGKVLLQLAVVFQNQRQRGVSGADREAEDDRAVNCNAVTDLLSL